MSTIYHLPIVKNESDIHKTCKMLLSIGVIVIVVMYIMLWDSNKQYKDCVKNTIEPMASFMPGYKQAPVKGKYIYLINSNSKKLPVYKIAIMSTDGKIIALYTHYAEYKDIANGSSLRFELPASITISQIIIDLNLNDDNAKNITTTHVEIRDDDNDLVWENSDMLHKGRYVTVDVAQRYKIYPAPQQILDTNLPVCGQEVTLGYHLMNNTW